MAISNNERKLDQLSIIKDAVNSELVKVQTCLPAIVVAVNFEANTVDVQPAIQATAQQADGTLQLVNYPVLQDLPIVFPSGGGCVMTFPIKENDECQVIFSSRCIDLWWQSGGIQPQFEPRKHDLSDGFAFFGGRSQPNRVDNISEDSVQIRSDDGQTFISLNPEEGKVTIEATNTVVDSEVEFKKTVIFRANVIMDGNLDVAGALKNAGTPVGNTHTHPNGSPNTGTPNP